NLGKIIGHENYSFRIGIQDIACSHVGIFGNTGSGKSNTLAKIYNEIISEYSESMAFKKNSKFVVFDFNGEYSNVFPGADEYILSTRHRQGDSTKYVASDEKKYPISIKDILNPEIWAIILEATEKTQKPFIKRCIRKFEQLKDGKCIFSVEHFCDLIIKTQTKYPELKYIIGDILDVFGLKEKFDDFESKIFYNGQSKQFYVSNNYTITSDFIRTTIFQNVIFNDEGINKLSIFELFEFAIKYNYWLEISRSYITKEHIAPLVARTGTRCEDMQKIFDVLLRETDQNLQQKQSNVEVISFLDLNLAMKKIVPMIIAKVKYSEKKAQKQNVLRSTLHFIIDEAHNILSDMSFRESEEWKDYRLESFEEIIKEGRKFGTFLTISSQRPSDISDTIISQLHNYFIHRLVNEEDLRKMYRSVAFADKASNEMIPILPAGGCLVSGLATSFPVLVQIDLLPNERRPKSENVNIETVWEDY
ncbi:MAG: ATP-binding protein, partial [Faecalimonas sp.]|nr:ATP-binding protein [Faecalimonas sp.]